LSCWHFAGHPTPEDIKFSAKADQSKAEKLINKLEKIKIKTKI